MTVRVDIDRSNRQIDLNPRHIQTAAAALGIRRPIRIRWMGSELERADGLYLETPGLHTIALRTGRSAGETAETIRHELIHAAQAELPGGLSAYSEDAQEQQARELAGCLDGLAIARDRGGC
jgi:hypothetical protein